ncbi:MAG: hypothetical protein ACKOZY_13070, partial [Flavobacteriales bacterium]
HHYVSSPGSYTCQLLDANGCSTLMTVMVSATQVQEIFSNHFQIHEGAIQWHFEANTKVRLFSSNGRLVREGDVGAGNHKWELKQGIYLAIVNDERIFRIYVP